MKKLHKTKQNQKGFAIVEAIIIAFVIVGVTAGASYVYRNKSGTNSTNQLISKTKSAGQANSEKLNDAELPLIKIKGQQIRGDAYYTLSIGDTQYYGQITKINEDYIRLTPVFYSNTANALTALGNEVHAPEPVMYINEANVSAFTPLPTSDTHYSAIQTFFKSNSIPTVQDAYPSADIAKYIKASDYQALFFNDGKIYFAHAGSFKGSDLFSNAQQVYTLQTTGNQVSLTKVPSTQLSSYSSSQLQFWENMKPDGKVPAAIAAFIKSNP